MQKSSWHSNRYPIKRYTDALFISVYLSWLPDAHLSDAPKRQLVVTGDNARTQDEITKSSAWFFNSVYSTVTRDLGLKAYPKDKLVVIRLTSPGIEPKNLEFSSRTLNPTELFGLVRYVTTRNSLLNCWESVGQYGVLHAKRDFRTFA